MASEEDQVVAACNRAINARRDELEDDTDYNVVVTSDGDIVTVQYEKGEITLNINISEKTFQALRYRVIPQNYMQYRTFDYAHITRMVYLYITPTEPPPQLQNDVKIIQDMMQSIVDANKGKDVTVRTNQHGIHIIYADNTRGKRHFITADITDEYLRQYQLFHSAISAAHSNIVNIFCVDSAHSIERAKRVIGNYILHDDYNSDDEHTPRGEHGLAQPRRRTKQDIDDDDHMAPCALPDYLEEKFPPIETESQSTDAWGALLHLALHLERAL